MHINISFQVLSWVRQLINIISTHLFFLPVIEPSKVDGQTLIQLKEYVDAAMIEKITKSKARNHKEKLIQSYIIFMIYLMRKYCILRVYHKLSMYVISSSDKPYKKDILHGQFDYLIRVVYQQVMKSFLYKVRTVLSWYQV